MTWKPRPYDPDNQAKLSTAQKKAITRNFHIFRLRGLYFHAWLLTGKRRERMQSLIDAELKAMGAEPQTVRMQREKRVREAEAHRHRVIESLHTSTEIPF